MFIYAIIHKQINIYACMCIITATHNSYILHTHSYAAVFQYFICLYTLLRLLKLIFINIWLSYGYGRFNILFIQGKIFHRYALSYIYRLVLIFYICIKIVVMTSLKLKSLKPLNKKLL